MMELDLSTTHRLGKKAFTLFFLRHVKWPFVGLAIAVLAWAYHYRLGDAYFIYGEYAAQVMLLIAASWFVFQTFRAYFDYRSYDYRFDKEFFHVSKGYIIRQEIGVVYHQIQTVTLKNTVLRRIIGVCDIIIIMTSSDVSRPTEVTLPFLIREKGRLVQAELLRRARLRPFEGAVGKEED